MDFEKKILNFSIRLCRKIEHPLRTYVFALFIAPFDKIEIRSDTCRSSPLFMTEMEKKED